MKPLTNSWSIPTFLSQELLYSQAADPKALYPWSQPGLKDLGSWWGNPIPPTWGITHPASLGEETQFSSKIPSLKYCQALDQTSPFSSPIFRSFQVTITHQMLLFSRRIPKPSHLSWLHPLLAHNTRWYRENFSGHTQRAVVHNPFFPCFFFP